MHSNHDQAFMDHVVVKKPGQIWKEAYGWTIKTLNIVYYAKKKLDLHFDDHKIFFSRDEKR